MRSLLSTPFNNGKIIVLPSMHGANWWRIDSRSKLLVQTIRNFVNPISDALSVAMYGLAINSEFPLITFNPVKTVNDLLRKEHQPA